MTLEQLVKNNTDLIRLIKEICEAHQKRIETLENAIEELKRLVLPSKFNSLDPTEMDEYRSQLEELRNEYD